MSKVRALLEQSVDLSTSSPRRDVEILLCHCLNKNRAWLYTWPEAEVDRDTQLQFSRLLAQRKCGVPIAHLTGVRDFWTLELSVNEHTLVPRPETETLVEWSLQLSLPEDASVLDLGTGSGAIALALAKERPHWRLTAVDASEGALKMAEQNASNLGLSRVRFLQSDWYDNVLEQRFQLIVGNPPYIEESDIHLSQGDLPHEPKMALVSTDNGLGDLKKIIANASKYLYTGGWLLLEHGYDQGAAVRELFQESGFDGITTREDLAGHERITGGRSSVE
ncbi:MAG: peptide chain release factor N(5)-glutamine methyltransferase [Halioglobus sp.]